MKIFLNVSNLHLKFSGSDSKPLSFRKDSSSPRMTEQIQALWRRLECTSSGLLVRPMLALQWSQFPVSYDNENWHVEEMEPWDRKDGKIMWKKIIFGLFFGVFLIPISGLHFNWVNNLEIDTILHSIH